ncbi:MAG: Transcription termination protein NusB, partial [uncultured Nocardioidaceae bacterium]
VGHVRPHQGPQASSRRAVRERGPRPPARRHPRRAAGCPGAAGQGVHRRPRPRGHRAPLADRRAAVVVLRGVEPGADARGRPQRPADRRLRGAVRRRRARRRRGDRGDQHGQGPVHGRVALVRQRGPGQHRPQQGHDHRL